MPADTDGAGSSRLKKTLLVLTTFIVSLAGVVGALNTIFAGTKSWVCGIGLSFSWCASPPVAEKWSLDAGGTGGGVFEPITCRPGQVVVGLYGKSRPAPERFIASIGPICAAARFDQKHQIASMPAEAPSRGDEVGSSFGDSFELKCPSNMVVIGSELHTDVANIGFGPQAYLVSPLILRCAAVLSSADASLITKQAGAGQLLPTTSKKPFSCPDGDAVFGVRGRAGAFVDALALGCRAY
jgi:hypothetical protein